MRPYGMQGISEQQRKTILGTIDELRKDLAVCRALARFHEVCRERRRFSVQRWYRGRQVRRGEIRARRV